MAKMSRPKHKPCWLLRTFFKDTVRRMKHYEEYYFGTDKVMNKMAKELRNWYVVTGDSPALKQYETFQRFTKAKDTGFIIATQK